MGSAESFSTGHGDTSGTAGSRSDVVPPSADPGWKSAFDALDDPVCLMNLDMRISDCNQAWTRFFGLGNDDATSGCCWELVHGEERPIENCPFTRMLETEKTEEVLLPLRGRWFSVRAYPMRDAEGRLIGGVHMLHDVTEAHVAGERDREKREHLARIRRMEAVETLAGGVAHDLNNCLGPLVSLPSLMEEDLRGVVLNSELMANVEESLESMRVSALRAAKVVKDLVTVTRHSVGDRQPVDIDETIRVCMDLHSIKEMRANAPGVTVRLELSAEPLVVEAAQAQLVRALENIIVNAFESFPDSKGLIHIVTSKCRSAAPAPAGVEALTGPQVQIEVRDTGDGMSGEVRERAFEPFMTGRNRALHSGLGLAVVHGIVRDHGGWVSLDSSPGNGTVVRIALPMSHYESTQPCQESAGSLGRVLVVDDEPCQLHVASVMLRGLGYEPVAAANGLEALRHFERSGVSPAFTLVVLDLVMPGIDGIEVLARIRKACPHQPVLIASGYLRDECGPSATELDCPWIAKPYERDLLSSAIRKATSRPVSQRR